MEGDHQINGGLAVKPPSFQVPFLERKPMLATKPKPKRKSGKLGPPDWQRAERIEVISSGPVKVRIGIVPAGAAYVWRTAFQSQPLNYDDPEFGLRRPVRSRAEAALAACDHLLRVLAIQADSFTGRNAPRASEFQTALVLTRKFRDDVRAASSHSARSQAQELPADFDFCSLHKPASKGPPLLSFDPKQKKAMAIARRSDVQAVIDVPSVPAEKLTTEEKRLLVQREKEIERSAHAFLDLGKALAEIQAKRLYRATHKTFEAYLAERWHIERSIAYGLIAAVRVSAIADKAGLKITNESQCRPLAKLDDDEIAEVCKLAKKRIQADADGAKVPTAKIFAEVARQYTTPPDDLKRGLQHQHRQKPSKAVALIDRAEAEEQAAAAQDGRTNGDPSAWADLFTSAAPPSDGSDPDYWNGRPNPFARQLRGLAQRLRATIAGEFPDSQSHPDVSSLLRSIAMDLELGYLAASPGKPQPSPRRAK
jgi:hypothetical protein